MYGTNCPINADFSYKAFKGSIEVMILQSLSIVFKPHNTFTVGILSTQFKPSCCAYLFLVFSCVCVCLFLFLQKFTFSKIIYRSVSVISLCFRHMGRLLCHWHLSFGPAALLRCIHIVTVCDLRNKQCSARDNGRLHFLTSLSLSQFAERKFGLSTYLSQKVK